MRGMKVSPSEVGHHKTNIHDSKRINSQTSTVDLSYTLSKATAYKNPISLFGYVWRQGCTPITPEKQKYSKSKIRSTIAKGTSTGVISGCTNTVTFYGPVYTLNKKKAKSDQFVGHLKASISGINLDLVENVSLKITK